MKELSPINKSYINRTMDYHEKMLSDSPFQITTKNESYRIKQSKEEVRECFFSKISNTRPTQTTSPIKTNFNQNTFDSLQVKIDRARKIADVLNSRTLPKLPSLFPSTLISLKSVISDSSLKERTEALKSKCHNLIHRLDKNREAAENSKLKSATEACNMEVSIYNIDAKHNLSKINYIRPPQTPEEKNNLLKSFTLPKPILHILGSKIPLKTNKIEEKNTFTAKTCNMEAYINNRNSKPSISRINYIRQPPAREEKSDILKNLTLPKQILHTPGSKTPLKTNVIKEKNTLFADRIGNKNQFPYQEKIVINTGKNTIKVNKQIKRNHTVELNKNTTNDTKNKYNINIDTYNKGKGDVVINGKLMRENSNKKIA